MYRAGVVGLATVIACATAAQQSTGDGSPGGDGKAIDAKAIDANTCSTLPCDIGSQCGCPGSACDIDGSDQMGTACRAVVNPGTAGSACSGATDCAAGFVCLGASGNSSCHAYCSATGSAGQCGLPRGQCIIDITNGTTTIAGIPPACSSSCDPAANATGPCSPGLKCSVFAVSHNGSNVSISDCGKAGTGTQGASGSGTVCTAAGTGDDTLCGPNTLCTTVNNADYYCRTICKFPFVAGECPGSKTCLQFSTPLVIGGTTYGVCN